MYNSYNRYIEANTTTRVDASTHEELENRKQKDETFNDVLHRVLGLTPDIDDLTAYLTEKQTELAYQLIEKIQDIADSDRSIEQTETSEDVIFISTETSRPIARMSFKERRFEISDRK